MAHVILEHITKEFPGTVALDDVTVDITPGTIVALCGENGAGKSTLGKVLAGAYPYGTYKGRIMVDGEEMCFSDTLHAERFGICMVHQELNMIPEMTISENISLGNMPNQYGRVNKKAMDKRAEDALNRLGIKLDLNRKMKDLPISIQQMVEIAKAVSRDPHLIIFDEPTSSLSNKEIKSLFRIMRKLKEDGRTMVYVSHKLEEVFEICDSVVILKDGKFVNQGQTSEVDKDTLIQWMIGRELEDMFVPKKQCDFSKAPNLLRVKDWNVYEGNRHIVKDVSLEVKRGEILGLYGLVGAGRTEFVNSLFEGDYIPSEGEVYMEDKQIHIKSSKEAIKGGIGLVTEDRRKTGLIVIHSIIDNMTLASMRRFIGRFFRRDKAKEYSAVQEMISKLSIRLSNVEMPVGSLSGGNQQKVVISKWLLTNPKILILDEPTRGIDVGTKREIYFLLQKLADEGVGILFISSELPEILGVSDRILVMRAGEIVGEFPHKEATEEKIARKALEG